MEKSAKIYLGQHWYERNEAVQQLTPTGNIERFTCWKMWLLMTVILFV